MFTGITEALGTVTAIIGPPGPQTPSSAGAGRITVAVPWPLAAGESVAVNGVCLTSVGHSEVVLTADVMPRTLETTTLGRLRRDDRVNLERAVRAGDRLGGHLVQGHVEGVAVLVGSNPATDRTELTFQAPPEIAPYLISRGSVALDGVSLTVADRRGSVLTVGLIPSTQELTTLGRLRPGDEVNIETDLLARHVQQLLRAQPEADFLRATPPP